LLHHLDAVKKLAPAGADFAALLNAPTEKKKP
jgi:hypothetical protein